MHRWLIGLAPFRDLVANHHARFLGPSRLAKAFPTGSAPRCSPTTCGKENSWLRDALTA